MLQAMTREQARTYPNEPLLNPVDKAWVESEAYHQTSADKQVRATHYDDTHKITIAMMIRNGVSRKDAEDTFK